MAEKQAQEIESEESCECMKIIGHTGDVKWMLWPRQHQPSAGALALADWTQNPYIWLHYIESCDGILPEDDVLRAYRKGHRILLLSRQQKSRERTSLYRQGVRDIRPKTERLGLWSTHTRYWSIHDVQRYFIGEMHCEQVLFTCQYPNLRMRTRLGSYFWRTNTALKLSSSLYQKEFVLSLEITLKKMEMRRDQMDRLIVSDQLINIDRYEYFKRKTFFRLLRNILSFQDRLQLVSFENLCCKRLEGVQLIQQLACFNADTLKYLFLWRFVLPNENPILVNFSYITGSGQYIPRPDSRQCFLRSLGALTNLRVLALEYAHIADSTGAALISLLPIIKRPHFRLQLICREDQTPRYTDSALGGAGHYIPDTAWRRVLIACPDLYVLMAFYRIRDYDNIRRFLTPSIPLRETHLQLGIDLKMRQRQDSDLSCFIRHIAFRYAYTLVTLSIQQWRFALFPLRRVFELMPFLVRFFFVGRVEDEFDLQRMLRVIACGVHYKLKHIKIQIQDEESKRKYWQNVVDCLTNEYRDIMDLYDIHFCLSVYKN